MPALLGFKPVCARADFEDRFSGLRSDLRAWAGVPAFAFDARGGPLARLFIRGRIFEIETEAQLYYVLGMGSEPDDTGRRVDLGEVAYEAYCKKLGEHQRHKCLTWDRQPPYMRDAWTAAAEAVKETNG